MTEEKKEEGKPPETAKKSEPRLSGKQVAAAISVAASLIGVLAFFGIGNFSQLRHDIIPGPAPSAMVTPAASQDSPTHAGSAAPTSTTDPSATSSPAAFNPASLDSAQTDRTPFTAAALLPVSFTDSNDVHYSLITSGQQPCINAAYMTANVRNLLTSSGGCEATTGDYVMTGDYLADGSGIDSGNEIMISVQVFPLANAATAQQIYNTFPTASPWDFGLWCPASGSGSSDCGSGYPAATARWFIQTDHRYLIAATALYADLSAASDIAPWLRAAAEQAVSVSGTGNYSGNR